MAQTLWGERSANGHTSRDEQELERVLDVMRRLKCHLRPREVASHAGLHRIRAGRALRELERRGLVRVAFWGLTERGKR